MIGVLLCDGVCLDESVRVYIKKMRELYVGLKWLSSLRFFCPYPESLV